MTTRRTICLRRTGTALEHYEPCPYTEHARPGVRNLVFGGHDPVPGAVYYQLWDGADAQTNFVCGNTGYPFYHNLYCAPWFSEFYGSVYVPSNPNTTDPIYEFNVWNGIVAPTGAPGKRVPIIQPVIEWGKDGKNQGGAYWKVGLWFGDSNGNFQEWGITAVSPGDLVNMLAYVTDATTCGFGGNMSGNGCTYTMEAYNNSFFNSVTLYTVSGIFSGTYRAVIENYWNVDPYPPPNYCCDGVPCNVLPPGGAVWTNTWTYQPMENPTSYHYINPQIWQTGGSDPLFNCQYQEVYPDQVSTYQLY